MTKIFKENKGFTLIELLVVVSIIGVLSGIVLSSIKSANVKARNHARLAKVDQIAKGIEIGVTGTTNRLPYSSSPWDCIGKTQCYADATYPAGRYDNNATLDNVIINGIAGGIISPDPIFTTGQWGDAVIYHSRRSAFAPNPAGAYLLWVMEDQNGDDTDSCGRGVWESDTDANTTNPSYSCVLFMGDSVTTP